MKALIRSGSLLVVLALAACAQAPAKPAISAATAQETAETRIAFFIHHARNGETAAVIKELDAGLDVNAFDTLSQSALIAAVSHNHISTAQLLLDRGANPNLADPAGWTPFIHAVYAGANPELLQLLIARGADINARNDRGVTALYLSSSVGREEQVRFLLNKGADAQLATTSGYTPARIAQLKGLDRIVALLEGKPLPALTTSQASPAPVHAVH